MARYRAISTMLTTSGIAEDASVNTFHILTIDPATINASGVLAAWQTFMRALSGLFPSSVATSGHTLRLYNLADPEPRVPVFTGNWSFASALSGSSAPPELCITTSFQAAAESGLLQRRRRGRMYLGPLDQTVVDVGRISPTNALLIGDETANLVDAVNALTDHQFSVFSRVDDTFVPVDNGWVDNAVDVQRRRGLASTARVTWSV